MRSFILSALVTVASYSSQVSAYWRVACGTPIVQERIDPIVSPGINPSQHTHTVHGASNFGPSATYDTLQDSSCTNCQVLTDLSNYWFPKLYFQDPSNGTFEAVPNGGLLVYYLQRGDNLSDLVAFPEGFRMLSGNPVLRAQEYTPEEGSQGELRERALMYTCLRYVDNQSGYDGYGFPTTDCEAGFQTRVHFPQCWDGVNLDSPDHRSHVAFASLLDNGECPAGFPVMFITLFYEVTWDVTDFADRWDPDTQKWPFVYATGDPTGFSVHADFYNGWQIEPLQNAITYCNNPNDATGSGDTSACTYFTMQTADQANTCTTAPVVNEQVEGSLAKLPGCNPIQAGPGNATLYTDANCPE